jgi:transposase-like protein
MNRSQRKRKSWTLSEKREALEMMKDSPIKETMARYGATRTTLLGWKRQADAITTAPNAKRARLEGAGRKLTSAAIDASAMSFMEHVATVAGPGPGAGEARKQT